MRAIPLIFLIILLSNLHARVIEPAFVMHARGNVSDFVLDELKLYAANDEGSVEIFDLRVRKKTGEIFIPPMKTAQGVWVNAKILSIDRLKGKTLIVSTALNGYRNVWLHDGRTLTTIIRASQKIAIKEARFLDEKNFLFGTLGYDLIRYTRNDDYKVYRHHIEDSAFSDLALDKAKKIAVSASESGQITLTDSRSGKVLATPTPQNLDKVYRVAIAGGTVITAGEDRRVGVYPADRSPYHIQSNFLVYAVGLSPGGTHGVYSANENNDLHYFDTRTGRVIHTLRGQQGIPSTIRFFDENGLFSSGYGNRIYYWYLKEYNISATTASTETTVTD